VDLALAQMDLAPAQVDLAPAQVDLAKKAHIEKKPLSKKLTGPNILQKPCGSGPTHGLSSSTRKIYYFLKYIIICGTGPTTRTSSTT